MYSIDEIFQFAIRIEENGNKYYTSLIDKFKDHEVKQLFQFLASEEERHKHFFEKALESIKKYEPKESFTDEYFKYLKAFADNIVFIKDDITEEIKKIKDIVSALEFAKQRELDTIHYFLELKSLVQEKDFEYIDKIIAEEREHFLKLDYFKQKYLTSK